MCQTAANLTATCLTAKRSRDLSLSVLGLRTTSSVRSDKEESSGNMPNVPSNRVVSYVNPTLP